MSSSKPKIGQELGIALIVVFIYIVVIHLVISRPESNQGGVESNQSGIEVTLAEWALYSGYLDYDDVNIRRIEKLSVDAAFDYKIYADIEQGSIRCTIYLYVKLNSSETKVLRVHKDDNELANSLINDAKRRNPDWEW